MFIQRKKQVEHMLLHQIYLKCLFRFANNFKSVLGSERIRMFNLAFELNKIKNHQQLQIWLRQFLAHEHRTFEKSKYLNLLR